MNPITIIRGTDNTFAVAFTDGNGAPIDLTDQKVYFTVKSADNIDETDITDADALIQVTAVLNADPTTGLATVVLTNEDTDVPAGNYLWDLRLITNTGVITNTQSGEIDILDPITNKTT